MLRAHHLMFVQHVGAMGESQVLHKCDNPACCNPEHLYLGTISENMKDMCEKGRAPYPSNAAKLCDDEVLKIRARYASGDRLADISRDYPNITYSCVRKAAIGSTWSHLPMPGDDYVTESSSKGGCE
ncbi:MAG: HNH endonuclease signature motif containing protein [Acidimicrobiales bacterium]